MEKYEKIANEIADQSLFNNINKVNDGVFEFHQIMPKILTNLFVTKK